MKYTTSGGMPVKHAPRAYLADHPFLTDTVLHNGKTDNDRQIVNKQHASAQINQHTNQHNKQKKTAQIIAVCVPIYIQLLIDPKLYR